MIQIPQHRLDGDLIDLNQLLPIIEKHLPIETWMLEIEECLGENSYELERVSRGGLQLSHQQLKEAYSDIYQTIDGIFSGYVGSLEVINLIAIDSTCWAIASSNDALILEMEHEFGLYGSSRS